MSKITKGLATLVCWGCHAEVEKVPGRMDTPPNYPYEGLLFFADETFTCPNCEAEDDYAWSDFEESA